MLEEHLDYIEDRIRLEPFRDAIARVIRPGSSVADLGCAWVDVLGISRVIFELSHRGGSVEKKIARDTVRKPKVFARKKPYKSPSLQVFGSLHLLTKGASGNGEDGAGTMTMMSDRRLKENIVRIGTHPLGIGLYLFDYKPEYRGVCGDGRQFGVMADEVEVVIPSAVATLPGGYKRVNYAMLGISRPV